MQKLLIDGKKTLSGSIIISGSKNSALPILAATILNTNSTIKRESQCVILVNVHSIHLVPTPLNVWAHFPPQCAERTVLIAHSGGQRTHLDDDISKLKEKFKFFKSKLKEKFKSFNWYSYSKFNLLI